MSKQIDERVVSMQFDNKNFEQNVQTSMSTLDKLKQKLNLSGASKGLENVNAAAKNVNMSGLGNAVETVRARFSALEVMGVTALANITNSAVNAGKRMVSALTIAPISDGFSEYEMTLNAVQTTMAGTGKTAEEVEAQLKRLDDYADKTVYSTADMLNNLPKFTNAGVELEKATTAMIGIANATALAGGDAGKASIAFYNLGQAIGTGYLTRMDYNSINNAGIATMEWKNQMVEAAIAQGTLTKVGEDAYQAGSKTLTLQQLFIDGLQEQWATTDVMMKVFGDYGDETTEIGKKAQASAQDIKTFTQMMESLKATAGTGWKDTWQIIFGGLDEAKEFWTSINNFISGILTGMSDFRNRILEGALGKGLQDIFAKIDGSALGKTAKAVSTVTQSLDYYQDMVNKIWRGDYQNNPVRADLLAGDGHNPKVLQDLVNKGYQYKLTMDDVAESEKKFGVALSTTTEEAEKTSNTISELTDAQLKNIGLTEDEIREYRALEEQSKKTGKSMEELLKEMEEVDGRTLLIESLKNAGSGLVTVFSEMGKAWKEVFPPITSVQLYNIIKALNEFSEKLVVSDETADKLRRTFKGLFALIDIIATVIGGPLKIAFKIVGKLLDMFGLDILDVTAGVGDAIVKFRDWIDSIFDVDGAFKAIMPFLTTAGKWIKDMAVNVKEWVASCEGIKKVGAYFKNAFAGIKEWFAGLKTADNIPKYIIDGLVKGLKNGVSAVWSAVTYLATSLINKIKEVLGIHSPSKVMIAIGGFIVAGLVTGILEGIPGIGDAVSEIKNKIFEFFGEINWGGLFAGGVSAGLFATLFQLATGFKNFSKPFGAVGDVLEGTGEVLESTSKVIAKSAKPIKKILNSTSKVVKNFGKILGSVSMSIKANAIKSIAIAIALLAGSVWLLAQLDAGKLWGAVGAMAVLIGLIGGLAFVAGKFGPKQGLEFGKLALSILAIGVSVALMSVAMKKLGSIENMDQAITGLIAMVVALGVLMALMGKSLKGKTAQNVDKIGKTLIKLSVALLIMVGVIKLLSMMDTGEFAKGFICMALLGGVVVGLIAATQLFSKGNKKIGSTLLAIAGAIGILALVAVMLGSVETEKLLKGGIAVTALAGIMVGLMAATKLFAKDAPKIGATLMAISGAIAILALIAILLGSVKTETLLKGGIAVLALSAIVVGLMFFVKMIGKDAPKLGATLLAVAGAIAILALVAILLGSINTETLVRGGVAVLALSGIVVGLMAATRLLGGNGSKMAATLLAVAGAVAILGLVAALLGLIPLPNLIKGVAAVAVLSVLMAMLMKASKNTAGAFKSILAMTAVIAAMAIAVGVLSTIEPTRLLSAVAGMSILMLTMVGVMKVLEKVKANTKAVVGLAALTAVLALLGLVLAMMSALDVQNGIANATALSILLGAMTIVAAALTIIGKKAGNIVVGSIGLAALTVVLALLGLVLAMMSALNVQNAMENALVLSGMLVVLTGVAVVLALVGALAPNILMGAVGLAALAVVMALLGLILAMMTALNVQDAMENAKALSMLLMTMAAVCVVLALVGPLALVGVVALAALEALMIATGALAVAIGALMQQFPQLQSFLDTGLPVLEQLAGGIGKMIGAFIAGLAENIMAALPSIGLSLSQFMVNAMPFIMGAKMVDEQVLAGVGVLAAAILALTAAQLIQGVFSLLPIVPSMADLGTQLSQFMINAMPFIAAASTIKPEMLEGVRALADTILILTTAQLIEGIASFLGGGSSLEDFGSQLGFLGQGLSSFSSNLGSFSEEQLATVTCAAQAIKTLAEASATIPNTGGLLGDIVGENDLGVFAAQFPILGSGLRAFLDSIGTFSDDEIATVNCAAEAIKTLAEASKTIPNAGGLIADIVGDNELATFAEQFPVLGAGLRDFLANVGTFTDEQVATVDCAARSIKLLAEASKEIPNSGGWLGQIVGENGLGTFAEQFPKLGTGLAGFLENVGTFSDDQVKTVEAAAGAVKTLAGVSKEIPNSGGWLASIVGDNDLGSFAEQFPAVGKGIKGFADEIGSFGSDQLSSVNAGIKAVTAIVDLAKLDLSSFEDNIASFGEGLVGFGSKLSEFATTVSGVSASSINSATSNLRRIMNMIKEMSLVDVGTTEKFKTALGNIGTESVKKFVDSFTSSSTTSSVKNAASKMITAFIEAVKSKVTKVKTAFTDMAKASATAIKSKTYSEKFKEAGSYLVTGFCNGITENTYKAAAKASAMAEAALKAAREKLKINSPSRAFKEIGEFVPEGFAMGIDKMSKLAVRSSEQMGINSIEGLKTTISRISDMVNSDIDAQPTIRPVLDLSDVRSGSSLIGGMLSGNTLAVNARSAGIISSAMAGYQNGGNSEELASAIKALRKDLSDSPRNSYNINGITYDDGSNVADAVKALVRAARIERRV